MDNSEIIIKNSLARLIAVQSLCQYDFYKGKLDILSLMNNLLDNYTLQEEQEIKSYRKKVNLKLLKKLLSDIIPHLSTIDNEISSFLGDGWTIDKILDINLNIIRLATFELKFIENTPLKVIINEYVDIAGSFCDNKKVKFVNSILERIAKHNRIEEFKKIKNNV